MAHGRTPRDLAPDDPTTPMQFYHLNSQHTLQPVPALVDAATERFGPQKQYGRMKVGDQVRRWVPCVSQFGATG